MGIFDEYRNVREILGKKHDLVFFTENRHYYPYFEQLLSDLRSENIPEILYITSDAGDPLLKKAPSGIKVLHVKWMLGFLFSRLKASVMVMTMPDLDNFLFKRSTGVKSYVYVFHAAVSVHQQYRKKAFFHYDAIFCTGPYQVHELEMAETLYYQKKKQMISYGYPLLDRIKETEGNKENERVILVAPSWFEGCIFDTCLPELLEQLRSLPHRIVVRAHPEYRKRRRKSFARVSRIVSNSGNVSFDTNTDVTESLVMADYLVTDRSGIAFEFAFGRRRPVLFIDTALKQVNPDWRELGIEPIENSLRKELGISVLPTALGKIRESIDKLDRISESFAGRMAELEKKIFFNSPSSYRAGVEYIMKRVRRD